MAPRSDQGNRLDARRSIRRLVGGGVACSALLVFGVGGWASTTQLSGAVIVVGRLVVESSVKKVQHPTGGGVGELMVREGQRVAPGEILLKLDQTQPLASLKIIQQNVDELEARQARDSAERDGLASVVFPADLMSREADARVDRLVGDEQRLFEIRHAGREGQKAQLDEQIAQLREQTGGLEAELAAKSAEIRLNAEEMKGVRDLWDQHLIQMTRFTAMQRDAARLEGERGHLVAGMAEM